MRSFRRLRCHARAKSRLSGIDPIVLKKSGAATWMPILGNNDSNRPSILYRHCALGGAVIFKCYAPERVPDFFNTIDPLADVASDVKIMK